LFASVQSAVLVQNDNASDCRCPVRCRRVLYEPVLSNAQLSKLAFERLFLQHPTRKLQLSKHYEKAREIAQRVDKTLSAINHKLIDDVRSTVEVSVGTELRTALNTSQFILSNIGLTLCQTVGGCHSGTAVSR
jgi:hypothetical protein